MEKTVVIDGKEVRLKSTGAILLRYRAQFHTDALQDIFKFINCMGDREENNRGRKLEGLELLENIDIGIFQQLMWTLAKTADNTIPDFMQWLDSFDEFSVFDYFSDVLELLMGCLLTTKKKQTIRMIQEGL